MGWYGDSFPPYIPVAERKRQAARKIAALKKKGQALQPVTVEGRNIVETFWGKAWCDNLESYSDFENRLPRGRTYVRNGFVIDLQISPGEIKALVCGSSIYKVKVTITPVTTKKWNAIVKECAGKIDSLIELLQGKFSKGVMEIITHRNKGLFPQPKEIKLSCSCPDWADMCKHVAAVLYGIGTRLDKEPEQLFLLRQADHAELILSTNTSSLITGTNQVLTDSELSTLFDIDIEQAKMNSTTGNVADKKIITTKKRKSKAVLVKNRKSKINDKKKHK